jgi:hypothetical protein
MVPYPEKLRTVGDVTWFHASPDGATERLDFLEPNKIQP